MELLLVLVIIKFALEAEIFAEHCSASITALLYWLPQPANTALNLGTRESSLNKITITESSNLGDIISPESVILLVIVTEPASVQLASATRGLKN